MLSRGSVSDSRCGQCVANAVRPATVMVGSVGASRVRSGPRITRQLFTSSRYRCVRSGEDHARFNAEASSMNGMYYSFISTCTEFMRVNVRNQSRISAVDHLWPFRGGVM